LLETGGGMVKALPLIDRETFFCLNSDNIWLDGPRNVFAACPMPGTRRGWTRCC
jgi:MurNAc alpha-1-phosphate uridylyltransferase